SRITVGRRCALTLSGSPVPGQPLRVPASLDSVAGHPQCCGEPEQARRVADPHEGSPARVRRAALVALLGATAAGVFVRLAAATAAVLWFDEGTAGLMGRRTLAGEFLVYFHGQAYMG